MMPPSPNRLDVVSARLCPTACPLPPSRSDDQRLFGHASSGFIAPLIKQSMNQLNQSVGQPTCLAPPPLRPLPGSRRCIPHSTHCTVQRLAVEW